TAGCGGAFRFGQLASGSSIAVSDGYFFSNQSRATVTCGGGAIAIADAPAVTITQTTFSNNPAYLHGGGVFANLYADTDVLVVSQSEFSYNYADNENNSTGDGGGI